MKKLNILNFKDKTFLISLVIAFLISCSNYTISSNPSKNKNSAGKIRQKSNIAFRELDCDINNRPDWAKENHVFPQEEKYIREQGFIVKDSSPLKKELSNLFIKLISIASQQIEIEVQSNYIKQLEVIGSGFEEQIKVIINEFIEQKSYIKLNREVYEKFTYPCEESNLQFEIGDTIWAMIEINYEKYKEYKYKEIKEYIQKSADLFNNAISKDKEDTPAYFKKLLNALYFNHLGSLDSAILYTEIENSIQAIDSKFLQDGKNEILNYQSGNPNPKPLKYKIQTTLKNYEVEGFPLILRDANNKDIYHKININELGEIAIPFGVLKKKFFNNDIRKIKLYLEIDRSSGLMENQSIKDIIYFKYLNKVLKEFQVSINKFAKSDIKVIAYNTISKIPSDKILNKFEEELSGYTNYFNNLYNNIDITDEKLNRVYNRNLKYYENVKYIELNHHEKKSVDNIDLIFFIEDNTQYKGKKGKQYFDLRLNVLNNKGNLLAESSYKGKTKLGLAVQELFLNFFNDYFKSDIAISGIPSDLDKKDITVSLIGDGTNFKIPSKEIEFKKAKDKRSIILKNQEFRKSLTIEINSKKYNKVYYPIEAELFDFNKSNEKIKKIDITEKTFHDKKSFFKTNFISKKTNKRILGYDANVSFTKRGFLGIPLFWSKQNFNLKKNNKKILDLRPGYYYVSTKLPTFSTTNSLEILKENTEKNPQLLDLIVKKKSWIRASLQESLIPGWGRFYMDKFTMNRRDYKIFIPSVLYGSLVFGSYISFQKYYNNKIDNTYYCNKYEIANWEDPEINNYYNYCLSSRDEMQNNQKLFFYSLTSAIITNIINTSILYLTEDWNE